MVLFLVGVALREEASCLALNLLSGSESDNSTILGLARRDVLDSALGPAFVLDSLKISEMV